MFALQISPRSSIPGRDIAENAEGVGDWDHGTTRAATTRPSTNSMKRVPSVTSLMSVTVGCEGLALVLIKLGPPGALDESTVPPGLAPGVLPPIFTAVSLP